MDSESTTKQPRQGKPARVPVRLWVLLLGTGALIILPFLLFGVPVQSWTESLLRHSESHRLGVGLALGLLLATDCVMPIPSSLASTACGMTLGFAGGATCSFLGMSLSCALGYGLGFSAAPVVERMLGPRETALLKAFHDRYGAWMLALLRPVPVLAEASVVFCGLTRQPWRTVAKTATLGNLAVSLTYAGIGAWGRVSDSFLPAFGASLALSGLLLLALKRRAPRFLAVREDVR